MPLSISQSWQDIAEKIIEKFQITFSHVEIDKILFLAEDTKTPKKYADIRNVGYPWNFITEYKYVIIFYENNTHSMTDAQKTLLVYHELLHIDESFEKIRKHDLQDFKQLIGNEEFKNDVGSVGVNWDIDPSLPNILDDEIKGEV